MEKDIIKQTKNAFDFIQKLFFEISYLIKEIEGMLQEEEEKFMIVKTNGYQITVRSSTGLEPRYVENWLYKYFTVYFVPEEMTKVIGGQTKTELVKELKIPLLLVEIAGKELPQPKITFGIVYDFKSKKEDYKKFENFTGNFVLNAGKIFQNITSVDYEDNSCSFRGKFKQINLFSIESSDDIRAKIVDPVLKIYRG